MPDPPMTAEKRARTLRNGDTRFKNLLIMDEPPRGPFWGAISKVLTNLWRSSDRAANS